MRWWDRLGIWLPFTLGIALLFIGINGLNSIVNRWWPFDVSRVDLLRGTATGQIEAISILEAANFEIILAFLATVLLSVTGIMLPLTYFLNKRFRWLSIGATEEERIGFFVTLRQAIGLGLWGTFCVWLQMNRALNVAIVLLVGVVILLFELLLQIRARVTSIQP